MPRLSVPLTDEQHTAIKIKAAQVGLTQAEVARRLLSAWLMGDVLTKDEVENCMLGISFIFSEVNLSAEGNKELSDLLEKLSSMKERAIG